jgi:hypothetical protein
MLPAGWGGRGHAAAAANPFVGLEVFQSTVVAPKTFRELKEAWVRKQVALREREYTEYKRMTYGARPTLPRAR